jgi:tetratricopeptide (TPR) repeat protein
MNTLADLRAVCDFAERQFMNGNINAALQGLPADPMRAARPDLADHSRLRVLLTRARLCVSMAYLDGGDARPAHHALNDAQRIAERRSDLSALAMAHHERGRLSLIEQLRFEHPEYVTAKTHLTRALNLRESLRQHAAIAATLIELGIAWGGLRQPEEALSYMRRAYEQASAHGAKPEQAEAALRLALLLRARGDSDGALRLLHESRRLREENGLRVWLPFSHQALAETLMLAGKMTEARQHLYQAAELAARLELRRAVLLTSMTTADWHARMGQTADALIELRAAHRLATQLRHESLRQRAAALIERLSS